MKLKKRKESENSDRWLLTYSDLITLLMIFFVMMYASSSISKEKYTQIAQSLRGVLNSSGESILDNNAPIQESEESTTPGELTEEQKLAKLKEEVDGILSQSGLLGSSVNTNIQERGLVITLTNAIYFDSGKSDVRPEMKGTLDKIAASLKSINNSIRVEGHTDNVPYKGSSNWNLSSDRAANVVQYLVEADQFPPTRISPGGYGETRPVASNDTEEGRSKNRRIEIVIINSNAKASSVS